MKRGRATRVRNCFKRFAAKRRHPPVKPTTISLKWVSSNEIRCETERFCWETDMRMLMMLLLSSTAPAIGWLVARRPIVLAACAACTATPLPALASVLDDVKALEVRGCSTSERTPAISAKSKSINLVAKVTVKAPEDVEYLFLKDSSSSAVVAAGNKATLITSLDKGKSVVPVAVYADGACAEGAAVTLSPGFSQVE